MGAAAEEPGEPRLDGWGVGGRLHGGERNAELDDDLLPLATGETEVPFELADDGVQLFLCQVSSRTRSPNLTTGWSICAL